jgi:2-aminoadipate transaminase
MIPEDGGPRPRGTGGDGPARSGGRRAASASRDLERYAGLFASRTRVMTSSAMRDLMAITERPEVISLAGGLPDTSTFPAETLAAVMAGVAAESSARALQYGPTDGMLATRETIARIMAAYGADVHPGEIIVTTGGQQVIDLLCKALIDPGDVIVAEGPTYPGAVPTFSSYQADVVQVGMDEDGMRIDELEETLERLEREGRRPKFIYTVPTFQNPAGVTMSLPRRKRLVEVARERELIVLEDNPYGLLRFEGEPLPTLHELDGGHFVVYAGTFSKILSPGLRLGWASAPRAVLEKLNLGAQAADLCPSSFTQMFVTAYFQTGHWERYMEELRTLYRRRRDVMLEALEAHFPPEATWTRPQGGLFVWATLPEFLDTTDLLALALSRNVAFVPGRAAYLDGRGGSAMRLNFSGSSEDDIREGIRRIGELVREQVELYGTLTGKPAAGTSTAAAPAPRTDLADVLALPRRERETRRRDAT